MSRIVSAVGNNVRNALAEARRVLGVKLNESCVVLDNCDGDNLHRCTLANGDVVEVTVVRHARCEAEIFCVSTKLPPADVRR